MSDEIKNMLEKAERKLGSAKKLFEIGEYEDAQRILLACKKYLLKE